MLKLSLSLVIDSTGSFGWKQMYCEGFGGGTNTNLKRDDVLRNLSLLIHNYIHRIFTIRKMVLEGSNVHLVQAKLHTFQEPPSLVSRVSIVYLIRLAQREKKSFVISR